MPVSIWLLASHALRLTIVSVVALLEHSRKFDPDLRDWMGGGDTFCSEEGHEIIDDGQGRGFSAAQPAAASDTVWSGFFGRRRCIRHRGSLQGYGSVCGGPDRTSGDSVSTVGEHRSEGASATLSDEGATVGVAAAVTFDPAWLLNRWRINVQCLTN